MSQDKGKYRVRAGKTFGKHDQFKAGDIVELTVEQATPFYDKLIRLGDAGEVANNESIRDDKDATEKAELEKAKGKKAKGKTKSDSKDDGFDDDEALTEKDSADIEAG